MIRICIYKYHDTSIMKYYFKQEELKFENIG